MGKPVKKISTKANFPAVPDRIIRTAAILLATIQPTHVIRQAKPR